MPESRLPAARHDRDRLRRATWRACPACPRAAARERTAEVLRHVGPVRGALPADRRLLDRHEAAGQARPGARPRPAAAAPRRADQRPRPGRPRRDARAGPADRHRVRDRRHRRQPPARRDRAGLRLPRRDRCRPAPPRRAARRRSPSGPAPSRSRSRRAREALAARARSRPGCRPSSTAGPSSSTLADERPYDLVRDTVADLGLPLVRHRAAPPQPRGPVPRRARRVRGEEERRDRGRRPGGQHLRPRLPGLRRAAARPAARGPLAVRARRSGRRTGSGAAAGPRSRRSCCSALAILPAVLAVGIAALAAPGRRRRRSSTRPRRSATTPTTSLTSTLVMLFCAAQAPELFGRDQRYGVLPLYFSRVLTRVDYALARIGGLFLAISDRRARRRSSSCSSGASSPPRTRSPGCSDELAEVPRYPRRCLLVAGLLGGRRDGRSPPAPRAGPTRRPRSSRCSSSRRSSSALIGELGRAATSARVVVLAQPGRHPRRARTRRSSARSLDSPVVVAAGPARLGVHRGRGRRHRDRRLARSCDRCRPLSRRSPA